MPTTLPLCCCLWLLLQLTVTHAGVSKLLHNTHSHDAPVPRKAARMLSSKQQQAYLHPSNAEGAGNGQVFTEVELS
jgi:hypothetical protein